MTYRQKLLLNVVILYLMFFIGLWAFNHKMQADKELLFKELRQMEDNKMKK